MVRSLCRIFLVAGIVSVFSFGYVNDGWAWANCTKNVPAGKFCKTAGTTPSCRPGCYCEGGKTAIGTNIDVEKACRDRDTSKETNLNKSGIYFCDEGTTSGEGAKTNADCKYESAGSSAVLDCRDEAPEGKYCYKRDQVKRNCPSGCYCEGKTKKAVGDKYNGETIAVKSWCNSIYGDEPHRYRVEYLAGRGIYYCPAEFPKSLEEASKKTDCYKTIGDAEVKYMEISCREGTYLPSVRSNAACPDGYNVGVLDTEGAFSTYGCSSTNGRKAGFECKYCTAGSYCIGYNGPVGTSTDDDKGIEKCPNTLTSDAGAKDIKECYIKCDSGKYGKWDKDSYSCETCTEGCTCNGEIMYYTGKGWGEDFGKKCGSDNPPADPETGCDKNKYYVPASGRCKACPGSHPYSDGGDGTIKKCYCKTNNEQLNYYPNSCTTGGGQGTSGNGIACDAGRYYDGEDCVTCPAGAYCRGGKARKCGPRGFSAAGKSKCTACDDGFMANEDRTGCERALISVPAGAYLPAGSVTPEDSCPANEFCPGGKWLYSSDSDRGAFDCPPLTSLSGSPSSDSKDCNLNLTKEQMSYGIAGNKGCWKYATKENYVNCIFAGSGTIESIEDEDGTEWDEDADVDSDSPAYTDYTNDGIYNNSGTTPAVPTGSEKNLRTPAGKYEFEVTDNGKSLAVSTGDAETGTANTTDYVAKAPDTLKQVSPGEPVKATPLSNATMVGGENLTASPARSLRPTRSVRKR